jgi:hypothetical protein
MTSHFLSERIGLNLTTDNATRHEHTYDTTRACMRYFVPEADMLSRTACRDLVTQARCYSSRASLLVSTLSDVSLDTFRQHAFDPAVPALLPKGSHLDIPAAKKWFIQPIADGKPLLLNTNYLRQYGSAAVPIEITNDGKFIRTENRLNFFLEFVDVSNSTWHLPPGGGSDSPSGTNTLPTAKIYIAQASLSGLPRLMQADLPTPEIVLRAGKGDIYDSSIWLGQAPTYTPLHRDPNPNLFVQLAGKKVVRLYEPRAGNAVFSKVQEQIGGNACATMRGEEMMQGEEKELLEKEVWSDGQDATGGGWQAELDAGDALFIPKGWWHSIKGLGHGMNGSVNWWFR